MPIPMLLLLLPLVRAARDAAPPNVVVVLTDDLGFGDVEYNCHDNSTGMCAQTPNLLRLARSQHSAVFHRFYATAGICSPTRAAILTGRNNQRDCIEGGLGCDAETPAPYCAQGKEGALPTGEFSIGDAAKQAPEDYSTLFLGKWHLGDLWDKGLPGMNEKWPVSAPWAIGFDHWLATQAEASSSSSNCGCFQVSHDPAAVGPRPPENDIAPTIPRGEQCYAGGGYAGDWCFLCTNYYYSNATSEDPKNVSALSYKVPADDSTFILDVFEEYLRTEILPNQPQPAVENPIMFTEAYNALHKKSDKSAVERAASRPFLAHLCLHSIHEPHPALPQYYERYQADPDYLGVVTQLDAAVGRLLDMLESYDLLENTMLIFTSDNGPHMGNERTDVIYSTGNLRQCKKSIFEGGLRVPAIVHAPFLIKENKNVTIPFGSVDVLPTVMDLLNVKSNNYDWAMDGISMLPYLSNTASFTTRPEENPLTFWYLNTSAIIDNNWKLVYSPELGVRNCPVQPPYDTIDVDKEYFLFDLETDIHELNDLKYIEVETFNRLRNELLAFKASANFSQHFETGCAPGATPAL